MRGRNIQIYPRILPDDEDKTGNPAPRRNIPLDYFLAE
jgi:hypothetical protein